MIRGVLFDMDGVIVDSEPFICEAAIAMFKEAGQEVEPADFSPFIGTGENRYLGGVAEKYGLRIDIQEAKRRTYEIYATIIQGRLTELPGAIAFVNRCKARGLKAALATSADLVKVTANLNEIGLSPGTFDTIVNGLDVVRTKPDPEIYLTASRRLALASAECLVVEDALSGLAAARAAGARCLMLTTSLPRERIQGADWIVGDLSQVPDEVLAW